MLCQIAAELERADMEDCGRLGQCSGKGTEYVMLKMGRKCEEGGFSWIQGFGGPFLPFGYHQLIISILLQVDQSVERCVVVPLSFSLLPMLGYQRSPTLSQLVDDCLQFTNLEVNCCYLLLPGFLSLAVFFLFPFA